MSERGRREGEGSRRVPTIRVGPDAWEWLTAADRSGRVGGHFHSGVNAVLGSEALVSFQSPSVPIHPWALVADFPWEEIEEGDPVTVSQGVLSVGRLVLPLAQAEVVDLTFHPPKRLASLEELEERVAVIRRLLAETPDPFESEFDRAFVRDRDRILAEWQDTGDPKVLLQLIGRGPGTTPAGDDTLIGLLAGLTVLETVSPSTPGSALQATRHMLRAPATSRTSLFSAQALASAASGRFSQSILRLKRALAVDEAPRPYALGVARHILGAGHTTGRSALLGLVAPLSNRELECIGRGLRLMHGCRTRLSSPCEWET